ncbi:ribonuclease P protein component [Micrococcus sp. 2A]|uniref:ribonuclease P protein component n=1 Tax=unclassified Micrococcus TaxID=2620948 RepID=UPI002004EA49|nr:ribonuclease P protein component [Micrococcus sp. M4NT]MCK6095557.1 ribonuclease P protein component [Micrococcus sp. EYE_212]MCK6171632.1 ribonuclease P protein component [Micrococcus sp. EYE_162]MDX2341974.1 ribonuclease P protein component [Micrococcus sp. M4NT]
MLPRDRRVRTPAEFRHIGRTGTRVGRRSVVVSLALDPAPTRPSTLSTPQRPRAGFVVSKSVGNAVVRNRVKRRLRDIVRHEFETPALRGLPVLVQVRALPAAADADHATLRRDVSSALAKALRTRGLTADPSPLPPPPPLAKEA